VATEPVDVYLGLGSNMGDRQANLDRALGLLVQRLLVRVVSSIYETEPVGDVEQPRFLNMVVKVSSRLAPSELLDLAKGIELKLGRRSGGSGAPRVIDVDILFYGDRILEAPQLTIPHPRLSERAFVLVPLAEISPELVHPVNGKTVKELLKRVTEKQGVFRWQS